mgnify:CR=1 FL=1
MAKKTVKKVSVKKEEMSMACCTSSYGMYHALGGLGLGLLVAYYFQVPMMMYVGWTLVALSLYGHMTGKAKCC